MLWQDGKPAQDYIDLIWSLMQLVLILMFRCVTDVYNVKTQMNLSIHAFSQALCVLTLRFQSLLKNKDITLSICNQFK